MGKNLSNNREKILSTSRNAQVDIDGVVSFLDKVGERPHPNRVATHIEGAELFLLGILFWFLVYVV